MIYARPATWPNVGSPWYFAFVPKLVYKPLYAVIDIFNLIVLLMIVWAFIRRIVVKPSLIPMNLDAGLILGAIGSLMLTHFLLHGYEFAGYPYSKAFPISSLIAQ